MKFQFLPFDDARLTATRRAWLQDAENGLAFRSEFERLFDWVDTHREPSDTDATAYGVFPENKHVATGICEVTVQRKSIRSKWVKLLRLHLKPSADEQLQAGEPDLAMAVFSHCMIGTMGLQLTHRANTLKVYGRTPEQLTFLKVLVSRIDKEFGSTPDVKVRAVIEGRFLSISVN